MYKFVKIMSIADWVEIQAPGGRYTFSKVEVTEIFPQMSVFAIDTAIQRLVDKGRIFSPCRGFYVIVPEEFKLWKAVPQEVYLDRMMSYLNKKYYVSLLNAAERYGAAHQAPMGYSVMLESPGMRDRVRENYVIRYIDRRNVPMRYVDRIAVQWGWLNVSSRELTALDLVTYQGHVGGLSRVATVLEELSIGLNFNQFTEDFLKVAPIPAFQRLGFLLESVLGEEQVADGLRRLLKSAGARRKLVPLQLGVKVDGCEVDKKWNVIVNQQIEIDEI